MQAQYRFKEASRFKKKGSREWGCERDKARSFASALGRCLIKSTSLSSSEVHCKSCTRRWPLTRRFAFQSKRAWTARRRGIAGTASYCTYCPLIQCLRRQCINGVHQTLHTTQPIQTVYTVQHRVRIARIIRVLFSSPAQHAEKKWGK